MSKLHTVRRAKTLGLLLFFALSPLFPSLGWSQTTESNVSQNSPLSPTSQPVANSPASQPVSALPIHVLTVTETGRVQLDGREIDSEPGKLIGRVSWRTDHQALAFIQESASGLTLIVLPLLDDPQQILSWPIPRIVKDRKLRIFWSGLEQVFLGRTLLEPRLNVRWKLEQQPSAPAVLSNTPPNTLPNTPTSRPSVATK